MFRCNILKLTYSEKATKYFEISSYVEPVKSRVEISLKFVAISEYMNFTNIITRLQMSFLFKVSKNQNVKFASFYNYLVP